MAAEKLGFKFVAMKCEFYQSGFNACYYSNWMMICIIFITCTPKLHWHEYVYLLVEFGFKFIVLGFTSSFF